MEQEVFLQQFEPSSWSEIVLGRVAVPRLQCPQEGFDLWLCYRGATSETERVASMKCIAAGVAAKQEVIIVLFGDLNRIENHTDRFQQNWACGQAHPTKLKLACGSK